MESIFNFITAMSVLFLIVGIVYILLEIPVIIRIIKNKQYYTSIYKYIITFILVVLSFCYIFKSGDVPKNGITLIKTVYVVNKSNNYSLEGQFIKRDNDDVIITLIPGDTIINYDYKDNRKYCVMVNTSKYIIKRKR